MLSNRNYVKKIFYSKTAVIALAVALILLIKPTWTIFQKNAETARNVKRIKAELGLLKQRESELLAEIENLYEKITRV